MNQKSLSENKKKYSMARHHAWAGTVILSVALAIRILIPDIPDVILFVIGPILVVYIMISLFFTYKYRSGLSAQESIASVDSSIEIEKERLKLKKKKAKNEAKKAKKSKKTK